MAVTIMLLGKPSIIDAGGRYRSPRGNKAWALLAYLLLAARPPNRSHVADLLFPGADDPLGALRWNLAELRRLLGSSMAVSGDPLSVTLGTDTTVDALQRLDTAFELAVATSTGPWSVSPTVASTPSRLVPLDR